MGVEIFWIALITVVSVRAITVKDNYPQFLVLPTPQTQQYVIEKENQVSSDDIRGQELQSSGYYQFQNKENLNSAVYSNPRFENNIRLTVNRNYHYLNKNRNLNDDFTRNKQIQSLMPENCISGRGPHNSECSEKLQNFPFDKVSYSSTPYIVIPDRKLAEHKERINIEGNDKPKSLVSQKYLALSSKQPLLNFQTNGAGESSVFQNFHLPIMKHLIIRANGLENRHRLNYATNGMITSEYIEPQPSSRHEVYHETLPDGYQGNEQETMYNSFHPEVKKKKKEIHYHQHKHLHEHDHDQKHKHNHQSGHQHGHGHEHQNQHAHSHSHMDDHWHSHHEKDEHHHVSDHKHGHDSYHEHKHSEDHGHKHHNDHHHGHEAGHDHDEDHWNDHSHKHHSDHSHRHGHKHDSKHSHFHKENHGHKHHHKSHGKY